MPGGVSALGLASRMSATSVAPGIGRAERAVAVEHLHRLPRRRRGRRLARRLAVGAAARTVPARLHDGVQHVDEGAGERKVRPARIGGDVEEHDAARRRALPRSPAACRRAAPPRPRRSAGPPARRAPAGSPPRRSGTAMSAKGPEAGKSPIVCGSSQESEPPSARSPWRSRTGSSSSTVVAARLGLAKRTSVPPSLTQSTSACVVSGGSVPGLRQHDDGRAALDQRHHRVRDGRRVRGQQVGGRRERALHIGERLKQRLRGAGALAGDEADRLALPAPVEELHRAGALLAADGEARRARCGSPPAARSRATPSPFASSVAVPSRMRRPSWSKPATSTSPPPAVRTTGTCTPSARFCGVRITVSGRSDCSTTLPLAAMALIVSAKALAVAVVERAGHPEHFDGFGSNACAQALAPAPCGPAGRAAARWPPGAARPPPRSRRRGSPRAARPSRRTRPGARRAPLRRSPPAPRRRARRNRARRPSHCREARAAARCPWSAPRPAAAPAAPAPR